MILSVFTEFPITWVLNNVKCENTDKLIYRAKDACKNAGELIENHFPDVRKMVEIGSNTVKPVEDVVLTRYALDLIFQNTRVPMNPRR